MPSINKINYKGTEYDIVGDELNALKEDFTQTNYALGFDFIDVTATTIAGWTKLVVQDDITLEAGITYRFSIYGTGNNTRYLMLCDSENVSLKTYNYTVDGYFDYTPSETLTGCYLDYRSNTGNATARITVRKTTKSFDSLYSQQPSIVIGSEIVGVVGDTLQMFFSNFIIGDLKEYVVKCSCDIGKNFPSYYEVTPSASNVGNHTLTISIYLNDGSLYTSKTTTLKVVSAVNPANKINVLCLGDSRMAGGQIPIEASRRLKGTSGVATSPAPLNLTNFDFVGRLSNASNTVYWEGVPGHTWTSYLSKNTNNPFYYSDTDTIDFARYATDNCDGQIDVFCILLGINTLLFRDPFESYISLMLQIGNLLTLIHSQLPSAKIIVATEPCDSPYGGIGANYTANDSTGAYNAFGFNYRVLNYDRQLIDYFEGNSTYDYVTIANAHTEFQCEYAFPTTEKAVNTRSTVMETLQNNGVHPNDSGYWQLSDAFVFRALLGLGL